MITAILTVLVLVTVLVGRVLRSVTKPSNYPPGPKWYPFVGCSDLVIRMSKKYGCQWKGLKALSQEYSTKVIGLKLGSAMTVVVFGDKNISQVFTGDEFEGRPDSFFIRLRCLGKKIGITFADGELWKIHRRFTVKKLRNVGFGKSTMEKEIQNKMMEIVTQISNTKGPVSSKNIFGPAVLNILWSYTAGETIEEERLKLLIDLFNRRSKAFAIAGGWLDVVPWCRYVFPELSGYALIESINFQLSHIIDEAIQKHKENQIQGDDFIYSFLEEMNANKETFTDEQLRVICLDLLIAGSQTTSNVLEFALLTALRNPSIQCKLFQEISDILGTATPCWNDSQKLVYTSAFLLEVQRYYTIVPLAGPRRVLRDTKIDGYNVPEGTTILISLADLHSDPEIWEKPDSFMPERFIGQNGELKNPEHFYPFGLGRRRCPGDSLAKSFIFIVFVGIIQNFKVSCDNGVMPSGEPNYGLLSSPTPYSATFISRN